MTGRGALRYSLAVRAVPRAVWVRRGGRGIDTSTGASGDEVFAACADGRPSDGVAVATGAGSVEFTTTILGQGDQTFTVVPGSGSFTR